MAILQIGEKLFRNLEENIQESLTPLNGEREKQLSFTRTGYLARIFSHLGNITQRVNDTI